MAAIGVLLTLALIIEYSLAKPIYTVMEVLSKFSPDTLNHKFGVVSIYKASDEDSLFGKELMAPV